MLKDHMIDCNILKTNQNKDLPHLVVDLTDSNEDAETSNDEADAAVICGVCSAVFNSIPECEKHMNIHPSKRFKCDFQSENQKPERTESAPIS